MAIFDDTVALFDDHSVTFDAGASGSTFTPPSDDIVPPIYVVPDMAYPSTMNPLMRHFRNQTRGRNIFLMSDGSVIDSQRQYTPPNMIQPPTDPYVRSIYEQGGALMETDTYQTPYVTATMYGGSKNPVTPAQAAQLVAAGYTLDP
jgi:hypothetical protein